MGGSLDPEILAQVGRTSERQTELVTRRDIRKYSIATGQRTPRFLAGDEAPPTFHVALFWPLVPIDQLAPDGVAPDPMFPRVPGKRPMAGGLEIEYHRPIRPGDVLTATRTLANIREKQGSSGSLVFVEVVMRVVDDHGRPVLTETATRIYR
jgi:hydroxyacyl-ACP dehydratase HTD2-like protein with hotdog domain